MGVSLPFLVDPGPELTRDEVRRYARHLILPEVGRLGQRRLKNARVLVVGAGGLGSPALLYLAAAGVGTLGVIDFDIVDESNLHRQVIHGAADVGRAKVDSARDSVQRVNPFIQVVAHGQRITPENAMELVAGYDLVLDGTDNFPTRYLVNDVCALQGKPYVWASILRFDGQVSVFWAGRGPCYRCLFPDPPPPGAVPSCAEGGVLGVLCAAMGAAQAAEAVKLIVGMGDTLVGRVGIHDALRARWDYLPVSSDPDCVLCGTAPTIAAPIDYQEFCGTGAGSDPDDADLAGVTAAELTRMQERRENFTLVDVREPDEREVCAIAGAVSVPKSRLDAVDGLALLPQGPLVLHCASGVRSAQVLRALRATGRDERHLIGGIAAWMDDLEIGVSGR